MYCPLLGFFMTQRVSKFPGKSTNFHTIFKSKATLVAIKIFFNSYYHITCWFFFVGDRETNAAKSATHPPRSAIPTPMIFIRTPPDPLPLFFYHTLSPSLQCQVLGLYRFPQQFRPIGSLTPAPDVTPEELQKAFPLAKAARLLTNRKGEFTGQAFVYFQTANEAAAAVGGTAHPWPFNART